MQDLGEYFEDECGEVVDVYIPLNRDGRPKGIGFVEFESAESAAAAVETLHGAPLEGRDLVVEPAGAPRPTNVRRHQREEAQGDRRCVCLHACVH